ncbi:hypothetical protein MYX77_02480 [Acidobacteriia bacterium AH_259_A11_L15]|nr:hypothetical protein [Acidobacteriia bacterium AH_259_A11_L15]
MLAKIIFGFTLVMVAVHIGEWVLLGQLARASRQRPLRSSPFTRGLGLMNFLRVEVLYYVVLIAFWLQGGTGLPGVAVFLLGAIHLGGWAALERKELLPQLEAVALIAVHNPEAEAGGSRLRRLLAGIAAFDFLEVLVLAFIAYRLWPA